MKSLYMAIRMRLIKQIKSSTQRWGVNKRNIFAFCYITRDSEYNGLSYKYLLYV
nr:MAG TPA: hypothetical protein [Caudoviricetes sp.]